jgi:hypothetical protein
MSLLGTSFPLKAPLQESNSQPAVFEITTSPLFGFSEAFFNGAQFSINISGSDDALQQVSLINVGPLATASRGDITLSLALNESWSYDTWFGSSGKVRLNSVDVSGVTTSSALCGKLIDLDGLPPVRCEGSSSIGFALTYLVPGRYPSLRFNFAVVTQSPPSAVVTSTGSKRSAGSFAFSSAGGAFLSAPLTFDSMSSADISRAVTDVISKAASMLSTSTSVYFQNRSEISQSNDGVYLAWKNSLVKARMPSPFPFLPFRFSINSVERSKDDLQHNLFPICLYL